MKRELGVDVIQLQRGSAVQSVRSGRWQPEIQYRSRRGGYRLGRRLPGLLAGDTEVIGRWVEFGQDESVDVFLAPHVEEIDCISWQYRCRSMYGQSEAEIGS